MEVLFKLVLTEDLRFYLGISRTRDFSVASSLFPNDSFPPAMAMKMNTSVNFVSLPQDNQPLREVGIKEFETNQSNA